MFLHDKMKTISLNCEGTINMIFKQSNSMKVSVLPEQEKYFSSKKKIETACAQSDVLAFDIYQNELLIGFVMIKQFEERSYFLWDYAIDYKYQNQHYGTDALVEFISYMMKEYQMTMLTTTYVIGNEHAKHLYEKIGFIETDIVDEDGCHEVNMLYPCRLDKD